VFVHREMIATEHHFLSKHTRGIPPASPRHPPGNPPASPGIPPATPRHPPASPTCAVRYHATGRPRPSDSA
jgi:hypothetical protein